MTPVWGAQYKPMSTKMVGDLQWRVLHGTVALNNFLSVINPDVNDNCPSCTKREIVFTVLTATDSVHCLIF